ncbi:hypothetical protein AB0B63_18660 [Micromonospora sp. NPDC049081]|uniref:hypothetical protein n=1 Tax=Micromonospora sp. NPDC049081 TaxID=3155150 RepID=UPI0033F4C5C4
MTTTQVQHSIPRTADATPRMLPGPSDDNAWTAALVVDIADVPPCRSVAELVDTYGTADPDVLRAGFALADDVAAAERFASQARQVAA